MGFFSSLLNYYCQIYGMPSFLEDKRINEMLELVELGDRTRDKVSAYSKGMRQKLALARAVPFYSRRAYCRC